MYRQIQQLRRGVDVIIATPGRLQDLISQGEATLAEVVVTVLDEADFMADLGFLPGRQGAARPDRPQRPAAAVLGHAGRRGRLPGPPLPQGPGPARGRPPRRRGPAGRAPGVQPRVPRQAAGGHRARRPPGPHDHLRPHPAGRGPAGREPEGRRHQGRGDPRRTAPVGAQACAGGVHRRPLAGPRRHRRRRARHPRRRRLAGPALRPADGRQDLPAPLGPHRPRRCRRCRRLAAAARPGGPVQAPVPHGQGGPGDRPDPSGRPPILDLVAKGVAVEPKERTQRDMRRGPGGPGGRPRRDGDRPTGGHRGGPRRSFGDKPRPAGERSSGGSYGERSSGGVRTATAVRAPGGRPSRPSRYSS